MNTVHADQGSRLVWGDPSKFGVANILEGSDTAGAAEKKGASKPNFDTLRGNGSPAGYMLTRGNIDAKSVSVNIDGRRLVPNKDYFLDPISGGLSFTEPVETGKMIRVTYQYFEGASVSRSFAGLPLLPQFFGGTSTANFLHAYRAADKSTPFDVTTFGMNMNFDLGGVDLNSLYYMSDPKRTSPTIALFDKNQPKKSQTAESSQIIVQRASVSLGDGARVNLGYQDIGKNFLGFATLREQNAVQKDLLNQLERERGLRRYSVGFEFAPSSLMPAGTPWNRLNWMRVYDNTGAMQSFELTYNTPTLGFVGAMRSVDPGFNRMANLSADELSILALNTRRQFDPNATLGQVTDADRQAATKESGLSRGMLSSYAKLGADLTGSFAFVGLDDGKGKISRQTFSLASKNWQGWLSYQTISPEFGKLGILSPTEISQFGKEYGMQRTAFGMSAKLRETMNLTSDFMQVASEQGGVTKANIGLSAKYLNFRAGYQSIDSNFSRVMDLADPQREKMLADKGYTKWDVSFGGQLSKSLKLDTAMMRADNSTESLSRFSDVLNMQYAPSDKMKVSLQYNNTQHRSSDKVLSGTLRDIKSFENRFNNGMFISLAQDRNLTQAGGGDLAGSITSTRRFETDKSRANWFSLDQRDIRYMNGQYEDWQSYSVATRLSPALNVQGIFSDMNRGDRPSESINKIKLGWAANKTLNAGFEFYTRETNFIGNGNGYMASLSGQVANRFGPLSNLTLTGEYGDASMSGGVHTFTHTLKLNALWGKNLLGLERSRIQLPNGQRPLVTGYSFKTDPDPKLWYHIDLFIKDKDAGWGVIQPIRNVAADFKINPTTEFAYTVNQYKELPNGTIELTVSRSSKLTTKLAKDLSLVFDWRRDRNQTAGTDILKHNIGFKRQAGKGLVFDVYYGLDQARTPSGSVNGQSVRMKLDQKIDDDQYLSFTGEATRWNNTNPAIPDRNTIEARLDFRQFISF